MMAKAFLRMASLEKRKQLQPKFSRALKSIADLLNLNKFTSKIKQASDGEGYSSIEVPASNMYTQNSV